MSDKHKFYAMTVVVEVDPEDFDIVEMTESDDTDRTMKMKLAYTLEWTVQEYFPGVKAVYLAS